MLEDGERRKDMVDMEKKVAEISTSVAVLGTDIGYIKIKVDSISSLIEEKYITRTEFDPVKKIVYGVVGLILIAVIGALVTLVVKK